MKNLITISFLLLSVPLFAQKQCIGIKGGVSLTNLFMEEVEEDIGFRIGFTGGSTYEYQFKNKFQLGIDMVYAQKGVRNDNIFTNQPANQINSVTYYNFDYVSLALKGGYIVGDRLRGFLNLGVVPSFLVLARLKNQDFNVVGSNGATGILNDVSRLDFSGLIEVGVDYNVYDELLLFTSFTYQNSFNKLIADNASSNSGIRHYGMIISFGFKFRI